MLRFADSFDHYATAQITSKWSSVNGSTIASGGRFVQCLRSAAINNQYAVKNFDSRQEWWVGAAVAFGAIGESATRFMEWLDNIPGSTRQVGVRLTPAGVLQVERNGTQLGLGTTLLSAGVFYFIEFYLKVDNTAGAFELRIDGATEISGSGVDTQNTANATANELRMGKDISSNMIVNHDDVYVCDNQGSAPTNTFLGDVRVEALFPSGNGNSSVLAGSDGNSIDNYALVDETTPNSDTDYVQSASVGDKDTYAYTNPTPSAGSVYGVQMLPFARKTDAGSRSIVSVARLSATEEDSSNKSLSSSYVYLPDIRETKPGGGAWSLTDVANAEFGVKVTV